VAIQRLELSYKSIRAAELAPRRVNVFIGEPNSGKSNLLEALALLSEGTSKNIHQIIRAHQTADLFFDHEIDNPIGLTINGSEGWTLSFEKKSGRFAATIRQPGSPQPQTKSLQSVLGPNMWPQAKTNFRYYAFRRVSNGPGSAQYGHLEPPFGENLAAVLYSDKVFRESIGAIFRSKGFRLEIRPQDSQILVSKEINDIVYSYPFESISETLQRIVFYKAVLETNDDAVLILDEPEANTFPFYTKYLAERIALDDSNQFFLTSHNPYVLMSIIEKTPKAQLAIFATRMRNYQTEFHLLDEAALSEMLELSMDVFFNLDRFFPE
jgi:AAA15 family ATPase/GTPase